MTGAGTTTCSAAGAGRTCPASAYIQVEKADAEVMRQLRTRLAAMEPDDPILGAIAERWRELTMPEGEGDRAVLQSRLDAVRGRIVDLEEARYVRGEFSTADDVARWDGMMARLKVQRDAVLQELEELGPPPDFDLTTLRATYGEEVWDAARCAAAQMASGRGQQGDHCLRSEAEGAGEGPCSGCSVGEEAD